MFLHYLVKKLKSWHFLDTLWPQAESFCITLYFKMFTCLAYNRNVSDCISFLESFIFYRIQSSQPLKQVTYNEQKTVFTRI